MAGVFKGFLLGFWLLVAWFGAVLFTNASSIKYWGPDERPRGLVFLGSLGLIALGSVCIYILVAGHDWPSKAVREKRWWRSLIARAAPVIAMTELYFTCYWESQTHGTVWDGCSTYLYMWNDFRATLLYAGALASLLAVYVTAFLDVRRGFAAIGICFVAQLILLTAGLAVC